MALSVNIKTLIEDKGSITRSLSLAEDAAQTLRGMILLEQLPPGTALPERDLAEALGVSRTPLRESIRMLANEGLVQYTASRRPFVADPSLKEIKNSLRVQGALEALAGQLACENATDEELQQIHDLNMKMIGFADGHDPLASFRADMDFHTAIVAAARNPQLTETHDSYNARLWRIRFLSSQRKAGRSSTQKEHKQIVVALMARDANKAAQYMRRHLKTAEKNIELAIKDRKTKQAE